MIGPDPDTQDAASRYLLDILRYSLLKQGSITVLYNNYEATIAVLYLFLRSASAVLWAAALCSVMSCLSPHHTTGLLSYRDFRWFHFSPHYWWPGPVLFCPGGQVAE